MPNIEVIHCHPHAHEGETLTVNYLRYQRHDAAQLPAGCTTLRLCALPEWRS